MKEARGNRLIVKGEKSQNRRKNRALGGKYLNRREGGGIVVRIWQGWKCHNQDLGAKAGKSGASVHRTGRAVGKEKGNCARRKKNWFGGGGAGGGV